MSGIGSHLPGILEHLQANDVHGIAFRSDVGARKLQLVAAVFIRHWLGNLHKSAFGSSIDGGLCGRISAFGSIFAPKVAELHDRVLRPLDLGVPVKTRELAPVGMW